MNTPRIAIVTDWIIGGGAERVVEELHKLYPEAPIYSSYCSSDWRQKLDGKVVTGYLQHWPFSALRKFAGLISPFRLRWYLGLDFTDFDIVISASGNGDAKHIRIPKGVKHICYCFSPVHYYWRHYAAYLKDPGFGPLNPIARLGLRIFVKPLRSLDYQAAQKPDAFVAISKHIQDDITEFYNRESNIIAPPVNVGRFTAVAGKPLSERSGFITMGRQVAVKRTALIVDACSKLELPLTVVGRGPEHDDLVQRAGPSVKFLTTITDDQMPKVLAQAQAFLFASEEDFGIAPVEAMAAGLPVIAYRAGGALDYVIENKTGLFFDEQSVDSLVAAINKFSVSDFDALTIAKHAERFSDEHFRSAVEKLVVRIN